jgi:hypothetical protein
MLRPVTLHGDAAHALALLLPTLGCGEEAAVMAFSALARDRTLLPDDRVQLRAIADDESVHDALINEMRRALPPVTPSRAHAAATRRFHMALQTGGIAVHLARIAALDAGVCTILSRLLRPGAPLVRDAVVARVLHRIHRDEARHVAVSRRIALAMCAPPPLRDAAAAARSGLADIVDRQGEAFERLGVDMGVLVRDLARLPNGLFS